MNGMMGWVVAALVVVAAGVFYFWPQFTKAPAQSGSEQQQAQQQAAPTSNADMPGTWRSDRDAKFTREIRADGTVIDRYEGESSAGVNGQWSTVADVSAETSLTVPPASVAGLTIVKVVWEGGVETTYFAINKLEAGTMTTTDLTGRGEVTIWTRL